MGPGEGGGYDGGSVIPIFKGRGRGGGAQYSQFSGRCETKGEMAGGKTEMDKMESIHVIKRQMQPKLKMD